MIKAVAQMPNIPQPFCMRDWRKTALDYDKLVFDKNADGDFMPLIWFDKTNPNTGEEVFGLPSYVGSRKRRSPGSQEGVTCISAVLGAALCGVDKKNQDGYDYVNMLQAFFNSASGENVFLNGFNLKTGSTFWYETYPNVLMTILFEIYPEPWLADCLTKVADNYVRVIEALGNEAADFNYTAFSISEMRPQYNGKWREPEAAAGYAFVLYSAYQRTRDKLYLQASQYAMKHLEESGQNPFYEIMLPWAALTAARLKAEEGISYDTEKLVNWCFDGSSACRNGWGIVRERWGDKDCHGLCGSLADWGQRWDCPNANSWPSFNSESSGYAFAANTFAVPAALVPMVRYDTRFAHDIGKWMLNLANNARLFYPGALPAKNQSCHFWDSDPYDCIAYEGLKKRFDEQSPYATGDPIRYAWGGIDLGLYGSSHIGLMASMVSKTDDEAIPLWDCLKTDTSHEAQYPTFLAYNPYDYGKLVKIEVGGEVVDVYDSVSGEFLLESVTGAVNVAIPPDTARVLVYAKSGETTVNSNKLLRNGIVIAYQLEKEGA